MLDVGWPRSAVLTRQKEPLMLSESQNGSVAGKIKNMKVTSQIDSPDGLERIWCWWPNLRYCPEICLEGPRKTAKFVRSG
jgi:hypothetical protein